MNEKRMIVALFGIAVGAAVTYVAYQFIAALTISVFVYYSTRRFHKSLRRFRIPVRTRAVVTLTALAVPLVALLSYTVLMLTIELRNITEEYAVIEFATQNVGWLDGADEFPEFTVDGLFAAYQSGDFDPAIEFLVEHAGVVTSVTTAFVLNLLIVVVVTYYLLIDGGRLRGWLLQFDDDAIVREYLEAVDDELEAVLFGNLLNVIIISLVAIVAFTGYNYAVPAGAAVPYPILAGALTGVASLIPVVGMKIVYVPLAAAAAVPIVLSGDTTLLVYVAGFIVVAVVVVDTIPDLILRPYLSGKRTHVGLLMLAYILGPIVFGFYGLFLAPILLVLGLTFADTALPKLLGAEPDEGLPEDQLRLTDFRTGRSQPEQ